MSALRVAVVGAGGNIGRTLLARLRSDGSMDARGVCRNELTAAPLRIAGFDVRCGSLSDPQTAQMLVGDCDVVVNCASASALPGTARREEREVVAGLLGVRGPRRLIHFSSVAVYGTCITARNRYERPRPDHPFGRDKLHIEHFLCSRAARSPLRELVVLRLGHVYGAEQWVSRYVFDQLEQRQTRGFRMPFGGRFVSNAIHVTNVASAVRSLVLGRGVGTFNLFDSPQSTWRDVFEWNTSAIGERAFPALDDAASESLRAHFARISSTPAQELAREVATWGRALPLSLASSSQQVRFLALRLMATMQSPKLEAHLVKRFFGGHLARRSPPLLVDLSCLFSQPAPGPCVAYTPERSAEDAAAVARWWHGYASPDALAPFPSAVGERSIEAQA